MQATKTEDQGAGACLTTDDAEWIAAGMAWVGLRHWLYGRAAGEASRVWLLAQMDRGRQAWWAGQPLTPALERLEAALCRRVQARLPPGSVPPVR